jgi:hypothetical protein
MLTVKGMTMVMLVGLLVEVGLSWAAESQKSIQLVARILPRASLSLDRTQVTFLGYEDQAVIPNQEGPVTVMAKGRGNTTNPLNLTVRANSDLESADNRIPIQQVQWTFRGQGFTSQALQRASDQLVARWISSGVHRGELQFVLNNNGRLSPGDYTGSVTLTLSSP